MGRRKSTIYYVTSKEFGRKIPQLELNGSPTASLGEILGLFAADGCFYIDHERYHYTLSFDLPANQLEYAEIVARMIVGVFGKRPSVWINKRAHTVVIRIWGKAIEPFLRGFLSWENRKTHTIRFRPKSLMLGRPFLRGIVRGLVAGDGSVSADMGMITFGVTSRHLALQYASILDEFRIEYRSYRTKREGRKPIYHVVVRGEKATGRFKSRIGLTDPAKLLLLKQPLRR